MAYSGPLRDEPIAVELHNTIYATKHGAVDALTDPAQTLGWLEAIAPRLGVLAPGAWPSADELVALREAVRAALQAAAAGDPPPRAAIDAINRASRRAPSSRVAVFRPGAQPSPGIDAGRATRADIVLAALASDAIELLTGPHHDELRTCGAPRCVLMFLKDHPRREWCSDSCGNRARQARHYQRHGGQR